MALILSDDVSKEAKRILTSTNSFEVLEFLPQDFSRELVLQRHEEKIKMLRKHFRNKEALLAKSKVDEAKMRLLDDRLREKECFLQKKEIQHDVEEREKLRNIEEHTRMLEKRAAVILLPNTERRRKQVEQKTKSEDFPPHGYLSFRSQFSLSDTAGKKRERDS